MKKIYIIIGAALLAGFFAAWHIKSNRKRRIRETFRIHRHKLAASVNSAVHAVKTGETDPGDHREGLKLLKLYNTLPAAKTPETTAVYVTKQAALRTARKFNVSPGRVETITADMARATIYDYDWDEIKDKVNSALEGTERDEIEDN